MRKILRHINFILRDSKLLEEICIYGDGLFPVTWDYTTLSDSWGQCKRRKNRQTFTLNRIKYFVIKFDSKLPHSTCFFPPEKWDDELVTHLSEDNLITDLHGNDLKGAGLEMLHRFNDYKFMSLCLTSLSRKHFGWKIIVNILKKWNSKFNFLTLNILRLEKETK